MTFTLSTSPVVSKTGLIGSANFTNYLINVADCYGETNGIVEQGFNTTNRILKFKKSNACISNPMNCYIFIIYCKKEMPQIHSLETIEPWGIAIQNHEVIICNRHMEESIIEDTEVRQQPEWVFV